MTKHVAIVGAGIVGRYVAWRLANHGIAVSLFERQSSGGGDGCSMAAAGLLTPFAEAADGDAWLAARGAAALQIWHRDAPQLGPSVQWRADGSLAVARRGEEVELEQWRRRLARHAPLAKCEVLDGAQLERHCPGLGSEVSAAIMIHDEGVVDSRRLLARLDELMLPLPVARHMGVEVTQIAPYRIVTTEPAAYTADAVIDCRGLGAQSDLPNLRSVRGELIELDAPELRLALPLRVHHPHHPIYLAPRAEGRVLVGATMIESDDAGPITVRSTLELLSAAYAIHPALRHARVVDTRVGRRPAFFDHRPRLDGEPGLMRLNGMYRHGFLLAPWWADQALAALERP